MNWLQFGIVSPFALQQLPPQPSADDSTCAKSGNGSMGAKLGNDSTTVSCESLRAWASQPSVSLEARSCGLDAGSSGGGQDQPTMACQKASIEIAMKSQVYPYVIYICLITYAARCKPQDRASSNCPKDSSASSSCRPAVTDHPVDLLHPSLEPILLCPAPGGVFTCPLPLQLVATPSSTFL